MATQTTGVGSTISFGNAPQANNDSFAFTEEANNILVLNVMANDLGGAAKTPFSVDDGTSASASTKNYAPDAQPPASVRDPFEILSPRAALTPIHL